MLVKFLCCFTTRCSYLQSFKEILAGKYDDLPEAAFYMQGSIEDVVAKAEQLAAQAS